MNREEIQSTVRTNRARARGSRRTAHVAALIVGSFMAFFLMDTSAGDRRFITESFKKRDFGPTVYDETAVLKAYGPGKSLIKDGTTYRWYRDKASGNWARLTSDNDPAPQYRTIEEVMLSSLGPGDAIAGKVEPLANLDLFGVKLGSSTKEALRVAERHPPMRRVPTVLSGTKVEEVEFFPSDLDSGLIYRFFLRDGKVVGMSVGVTE